MIDRQLREHLQRGDAVANGFLRHLPQLRHRLGVRGFVRQQAAWPPLGVFPEPAVDAVRPGDALERAAHRVRLRLRDLEQRHPPGADDVAVTVEGTQQNRMLGRQLVERKPRHPLVEHDGRPDVTENPGACRSLFGCQEDGLRSLVPTWFHGLERELETRAVRAEVGVCVVETRRDDPSLQIDAPRGAVGERVDVGVGPDGQHAVTSDRDGIRRRCSRFTGKDLADHEDDVRGGLLARAGRELKGRGQGSEGNETVHGSNQRNGCLDLAASL